MSHQLPPQFHQPPTHLHHVPAQQRYCMTEGTGKTGSCRRQQGTRLGGLTFKQATKMESIPIAQRWDGNPAPCLQHGIPAAVCPSGTGIPAAVCPSSCIPEDSAATDTQPGHLQPSPATPHFPALPWLPALGYSKFLPTRFRVAQVENPTPSSPSTFNSPFVCKWIGRTWAPAKHRHHPGNQGWQEG